MHSIQIIGNVGKDAEVKDFNNNQVINFSVAVTEKVKDEIKTTWYEVQKWGNNVAVAQYIKKGGKIYISGKPNNRSWVNTQGEPQVTNGIIAFEIELLGSKNESDSQQPEQNNSDSGSGNDNQDEDPNSLPF